MNRRFLVVLGLSAVLALVVSAIFYQITTSAGGSRKHKVETKGVVVATNPLPLGAVIKTADLKIVPWPVENLPPGAVSKIEEVVDRVALSTILAEEPVLDGKLAARGSGVGLSSIIPAGMRAVSVRVNDVISVAGFVLPSSRVDVMVTGVPRGLQNVTVPVTRTILSNIQVLSAGKNIQPDSKGQPENVAVVTLLVNPAQAEMLTLASNEGKLQLALRNNTDPQAGSSQGIHATEVFAGVAGPAEPPQKRQAPRLVTVRVPPPALAAPPPAPPPQIELIKGDKKTTEVIPAVYR